MGVVPLSPPLPKRILMGFQISYGMLLGRKYCNTKSAGGLN